jgi:hypothetical protein
VDGVGKLGFVKRGLSLSILEGVATIPQSIRPRRQHLSPATGAALDEVVAVNDTNAIHREGPQAGSHLGDDRLPAPVVDLVLCARWWQKVSVGCAHTAEGYPAAGSPPTGLVLPLRSSPVTKRWDPFAGILTGPIDGRRPGPVAYPDTPAVPGMTVVHLASRFSGRLVRLERDEVHVRGAGGTERVFRAAPGAFEVEGRAVTLVRAQAGRAAGPALTASGSLAVAGGRARVAQSSRILVEGIHDAQLVERVWGDDLRVEGVVVERLDGIDDLEEVVRRFAPRTGHRLGVLVDHLVPGSKEWRLAAAVNGPHVLVTGTPFIDVWEAVKPSVVGIAEWPEVPRGVDWKTGVCRRLGIADPPEMWRRVLASVHTYADLQPALVGAVEQLIDFVTAAGASE